MIVTGVIVVAESLWASATPAAAGLVVGVRITVFLIVLVPLLALGNVALVMTVVDTLKQVLLVDLSVVAVGSCRVMT